jgi:putative Holliday junction resolvase
LGRLLGIDFGLARIGIAISDERKIIATALGSIKTKDKPLAALQNILAKYSSLEAIVVGLPLLLNGKEGDMALHARTFATLLESHFQIPVIFWDERLSSIQVERFLTECGVNRKKRAKISDEQAAALILQDYLNCHSKTN